MYPGGASFFYGPPGLRLKVFPSIYLCSIVSTLLERTKKTILCPCCLVFCARRGVIEELNETAGGCQGSSEGSMKIKIYVYERKRHDYRSVLEDFLVVP